MSCSASTPQFDLFLSTSGLSPAIRSVAIRVLPLHLGPPDVDSSHTTTLFLSPLCLRSRAAFLPQVRGTLSRSRRRSEFCSTQRHEGHWQLLTRRLFRILVAVRRWRTRGRSARTAFPCLLVEKLRLSSRAFSTFSSTRILPRLRWWRRHWR